MSTSEQSNLASGRIAAANGRFSCIRQVAPMCTAIQYTKIGIRAVLVLPTAKSNLSISNVGHARACVERATPLIFKITPSHVGIWTPHLIYGSTNQLESTSHLDRSGRFGTAHRRKSTIDYPPLPSKLLLRMGDGPTANTWFPGPP